MGRPSYKIFMTRANDPEGRATDGVAASSTNTYYSRKCSPKNAGAGIQLRTTGTLNGTWTLWYSQKESPDLTNDADWDQDTTVVITNPAGSATSQRLDIGNVQATWFRLKYVNASGTGNLFGYV